MEKDNHIAVYQPMITEIKQIISSGRGHAYQATNEAMVLTYWYIGKRIVEQEQAGKQRAEYGKQLVYCIIDI